MNTKVFSFSSPVMLSVRFVHKTDNVVMLFSIIVHNIMLFTNSLRSL